MSYFVGIDIAKYTHVACVLDHESQVVVQPFEFENSISGFTHFLSKLPVCHLDDIVFGFESTAHYHENLFYFLTVNHSFTCELINPIISKQFRNLSIRNVKTDKTDSLSIARFLLHNRWDAHHTLFLINELNYLCHAREDLKQKSTTLYIQLTAYLDRVFPELKGFMKGNLRTNVSHNLLVAYSTAYEIASVRVDKLQRILAVHSKKWSTERVHLLKQLAKDSIGFHSQSLSLRIKQTIQHINLLSIQIHDVESSILQHMQILQPPMMHIPGMGYIQAAYILSVIGDISRFNHPKKLVAFAGLDPKIRQSGLFKASSTRMSKRGNSLLRYALVWAAYNVTRNSTTMHNYYAKKRSEGKSHYNALGHCAKKLVGYIYFSQTHPDSIFLLD